MITIIRNGNANPTNWEGAAHKENLTVITRPEDVIQPEFNLCDFQCPYEEPKFAQGGTVDLLEYKNDHTDLLYPISLITDTVVITLYKCENGENVDKAILDDDLYGLYFDQSVFPDNLKFGFFADWNLIYNEFGAGKYFFSAQKTIIGEVQAPDNSWIYDLQLFNEIDADNTIRIVTNQRGIITGGIDYTDLNWISEIRFRGTFGRPEMKLTKDHYQTQGRSDRQNKDSMAYTYRADTELVTYEVITPFINDKMLSTNMFISTYELQGFLPPYKLFNVVPEEIEPPEYIERNTNAIFGIVFIDKFHGPVKTNF